MPLPRWPLAPDVAHAGEAANTMDASYTFLPEARGLIEPEKAQAWPSWPVKVPAASTVIDAGAPCSDVPFE